MVTVQSEGCAPMVRAFHEGQKVAAPWQGAQTIADGLRVPAAMGDFLILRALRESQGTAVAVPDKDLIGAANLIGRSQGISACPEGGAALAAFQHLRSQGWIGADETVVLLNTGSGLKYAHLWA
jgi:threonine synthase